MELREEVTNFLKITSVASIVHVNSDSFVELFYKVFGRIPSCSSCANEVVGELELLTRFSQGEIINIKKNMKYKLKPDALVVDSITNGDYTERSSGWNDDIAMNVLLSNPSEIIKFESMPEDWEKQVSEHGKKISKAEDKPVKELKGKNL